MGAAADKGWGGLDNTSPMQGPAQITALADFLAAMIDDERAVLGDLPTSGNWVGRRILVIETMRIYRWATAGWAVITGQDELSTIVAAPGANVTVGSAAQLRKNISNYVTGFVDLGRTVANGGIISNTVFGIIPAGFRPAATMEFPGTVTGASTTGAIVQVQPSGNIRFLADGGLPSNPTSFRAPIQYTAAN